MNIWKRYSMRVSKNWVKFNKMFTLSPWARSDGLTQLETGQRLSRLVHPSSVPGVPLTTHPPKQVSPASGWEACFFVIGGEKDRYVHIPNSVIPPSMFFVNYH